MIICILNILRQIKKKISNLPYFYQWSLRISFSDNPSNNFSNFMKIIPPKDRFWADPFVMKKNEKYFIFHEEMLYSNEFGRISVIELEEDGKFKNPVAIIEKNYHLSYPFLFEFENALYLMIGSKDKSNFFVELFKCVDFPYEWISDKKILKDIPLVDPTIFYHDKKWWIFACEAENDGTSKSEKLLLFYSENPITGQWKEHPQNPVVSDITKARPAGKIFKQENKIIRPGQNCEGIYGHGFSLNEIIKLSTTEYNENQLESFKPTWDDSIIGLHTYNFDDKCTVIDVRKKRSRLN